MVIDREVVLELLTKSSRLVKAINDNRTDMWETSLEESHEVVKIYDIEKPYNELSDLIEKFKHLSSLIQRYESE